MELRNLRDIRRRITSIRSTQKITRAMKMVAAVKLRKAQERLLAARPYAEKMSRVISRIVSKQGLEVKEHPLVLPRKEIRRQGYVVLTSDRGLCGPFNSNLIKKFEELTAEKGDKNPQVIAVGKRGLDYFRAHGYKVVGEFVGLLDEPTADEAARIGDLVRGLYLEEVFDEVYLIYPYFINTITQKRLARRILPISPPRPREEEKVTADYLYEPSPEGLLDNLLPLFLDSAIYRALLEGRASEHGARMTAMDAATDNAEDMAKRLNLLYNRMRQAAITTELMEIVGGSEALSGYLG